MKLTEFAIKESRLTFTVAIFAILAGILAFIKIPRSEDPDIVFRFAMVTTIYPGASAKLMESLISTKLENAVREAPEVDITNSITRNNASVLLIKIKDEYSDLQPIWNRLRRKIERVAKDLPKGVRGPYFNDEYGEVFSIITTVSSDNPNSQEVKKIAEQIRKELLHIDDVAKVNLLCSQDEKIYVNYDDAQMAESGISPSILKGYLEAQNVIAPGGTLREGDKQIIVEVSKAISTIKDLDNLQVALPGESSPHFFGELVEINQDNTDTPQSLMYSSGLPCIGLAISMREGGNNAVLGREVKNIINDWKSKSIEGIDFDIVAFEPDRVKNRIGRFFKNLLFSLIIVMAILLFTLGIRTGLAIAAMMPLAILTTLAMMMWLGITMNLVALAALILVLGIMVDTHIVISERILLLRERGTEPKAAAVEATSELSGPLITSSLTTITGFLPLYLANSSAGEYVAPMFNVVAIALLCSAFYSFTVTPTLSLKCCFQNFDSNAESRENKLPYRLYKNILNILLPRKYLTLSLTIILFFGTMYCLRFVPKIFFPPSDRPIFTMEIEYPVGTVIEKTKTTIEEINTFVEKNLTSEKNNNSGITNWASFVGRNAPRFILNLRTREFSPEFGYFLFNVTNVKVIPDLVKKLREFSDKNLTGVIVRVSPLEAGPAVGYPIKLHVSGDRIEDLFAVSSEIKEKIKQIKGVYNVSDNWGNPVKKLQVNINQEAAAMARVTQADAALALQSFLTGIPATNFRDESKLTPIMIRADVVGNSPIDKINSILVHSRITKKTISLGDISNITEILEPINIINRDAVRTVTVQADVENKSQIAKIETGIKNWLLLKKDFGKPDISVKLAGERTESKNANRSILENLPWAGFIIFLLLLHQARAFRRVFIIMCAVPLGLIGVVIGLLITGFPFGFMTLVAIVALTGIVVNNALILMDRIRINCDIKKLDPKESIMEASMNRLRPITLTTFTTLGGFLPLYLQPKPIWQSMAAALIFGLLFATILVLIIVPVLYAILYRINFRKES